MSVVETDQSLAIRPMQRERIIQAVGPFFRRLYPLGDEFHPMIADRIDDKHDAIKRKKVVKTRIRNRFRHCPRCYHPVITLAMKYHLAQTWVFERRGRDGKIIPFITHGIRSASPLQTLSFARSDQIRKVAPAVNNLPLL